MTCDFAEGGVRIDGAVSIGILPRSDFSDWKTGMPMASARLLIWRSGSTSFGEAKCLGAFPSGSLPAL
eukprot:3972441-Pyramimonas_sp.AAC.1